MKTVKQALEARKVKQACSIIAANITQEELDNLEKIEIREQHIVSIITDVLLDYPSLIHVLAKMHVNRVVLSTAHGIQKPVIIEQNKIAIIYMNN